MKLLRHGPKGQEKPAILHTDGMLRDLSSLMADIGPIGPWLVSADEVGDPQNLAMWLDVNGERQQTGNTRTMIFTVAQVVSYLSRFMTLNPGDLITTGTPPGVGMGVKPGPVYLKPGDTMRVHIQGLGEQQQKVHAWDPALIDG